MTRKRLEEKRKAWEQEQLAKGKELPQWYFVSADLLFPQRFFLLGLSYLMFSALSHPGLSFRVGIRRR
jgi:hypothetical protein